MIGAQNSMMHWDGCIGFWEGRARHQGTLFCPKFVRSELIKLPNRRGTDDAGNSLAICAHHKPLLGQCAHDCAQPIQGSGCSTEHLPPEKSEINNLPLGPR